MFKVHIVRTAQLNFVNAKTFESLARVPVLPALKVDEQFMYRAMVISVDVLKGKCTRAELCKTWCTLQRGYLAEIAHTPRHNKRSCHHLRADCTNTVDQVAGQSTEASGQPPRGTRYCPLTAASA
jgi:hypothetical protein